MASILSSRRLTHKFSEAKCFSLVFVAHISYVSSYLILSATRLITLSSCSKTSSSTKCSRQENELSDKTIAWQMNVSFPPGVEHLQWGEQRILKRMIKRTSISWSLDHDFLFQFDWNPYFHSQSSSHLSRSLSSLDQWVFLSLPMRHWSWRAMSAYDGRRYVQHGRDQRGLISTE